MRPNYIVFTFFNGHCGRRKPKASEDITMQELSRIRQPIEFELVEHLENANRDGFRSAGGGK